MLRVVLATGVVLLSLPVVQLYASEGQGAPTPSEAGERAGQRQGFSQRGSRLGYTEATPVFAVSSSPQSLAITPSVQLLLDPALNPQEDTVWVWGLRFRFAL
jgi:hypothetical protein